MNLIPKYSFRCDGCLDRVEMYNPIRRRGTNYQYCSVDCKRSHIRYQQSAAPRAKAAKRKAVTP